MKHTIYLGIIGLMVFATSCAPSKQNKIVSSPHIIIDEPLVMATPLVADLDIETKKVEGTATMGFTPGMSSPIEECKSSAIGKALVASSSDVLIEPFYIIETTDNSVTVKVQGFPARYKNFRKDAITIDSLTKLNTVVPVMKASSMDSGDPFAKLKNKSNEQQKAQQQKGKTGAAILLSLLLGSLTVLLVAVAAGG